jgi:hypothetical protein
MNEFVQLRGLDDDVFDEGVACILKFIVSHDQSQFASDERDTINKVLRVLVRRGNPVCLSEFDAVFEMLMQMLSAGLEITERSIDDFMSGPEFVITKRSTRTISYCCKSQLNEVTETILTLYFILSESPSSAVPWIPQIVQLLIKWISCPYDISIRSSASLCATLVAHMIETDPESGEVIVALLKALLNSLRPTTDIRMTDYLKSLRTLVEMYLVGCPHDQRLTTTTAYAVFVCERQLSEMISQEQEVNDALADDSSAVHAELLDHCGGIIILLFRHAAAELSQWWAGLSRHCELGGSVFSLYCWAGFAAFSPAAADDVVGAVWEALAASLSATIFTTGSLSVSKVIAMLIHYRTPPKTAIEPVIASVQAIMAGQVSELRAHVLVPLLLAFARFYPEPELLEDIASWIAKCKASRVSALCVEDVVADFVEILGTMPDFVGRLAASGNTLSALAVALRECCLRAEHREALRAALARIGLPG